MTPYDVCVLDYTDGFHTFGAQVVDMGRYDPFVWRCDWRVARFASLTDMFLVIYLAGSCANSPLFIAFVGNACSTSLSCCHGYNDFSTIGNGTPLFVAFVGNACSN